MTNYHITCNFVNDFNSQSNPLAMSLLRDPNTKILTHTILMKLLEDIQNLQVVVVFLRKQQMLYIGKSEAVIGLLKLVVQQLITLEALRRVMVVQYRYKKE